MKIEQIARVAKVRSLAATGAGRDIRRSHHVSLQEAADAIGVAISTLHRWEVGERRPTGKRALRYAAFIEALLDGGMNRRE